MRSLRILFVCTGNVYRSMSAEKCLRSYLNRNKIKGIKVNSCGIGVWNQSIYPAVKKRLAFYKVKLYKHRHKQINQKLVDESDLIVAMNKNHQENIKKNFGIKAVLFNEIAYSKKTGVLDFHERDVKLRGMKKKYTDQMNNYADFTVDHIYSAMPSFVKNLHKFLK